MSKDGEVVVPELDGTIEDEPGLLGLATELDCFDDVLSELDLLLLKAGAVFVCELTIILVFFEGDQVFVADLDLLF